MEEKLSYQLENMDREPDPEAGSSYSRIKANRLGYDNKLSHTLQYFWKILLIIAAIIVSYRTRCHHLTRIRTSLVFKIKFSMIDSTSVCSDELFYLIYVCYLFFCHNLIKFDFFKKI